jgi:flagellar hook-associated protein 3 FlgL
MMTDAVNTNLFRQSDRLLKLQEKASTGKEVHRPSDDPLVAGEIMGYRSELMATDQYLTNITHAETRLEITENVLKTMNGFIETLWGYALNPSDQTPEERSAAADDIRNLRDQVRQLANTRHGGQHLFAGHLTDVEPFPEDNSYAGDQGEIPVIIGKGMDMKINTTGEELFAVGPDGKVALFESLDALEEAYRREPFEPAAVTGEMAATLNDAAARLKEVRAEGAVRLARMGSAQSFLESIKPKMAAMLSEAEDTDITKAITEMKLQQTTYETALQTASRVIQPTLLDFLR